MYNHFITLFPTALLATFQSGIVAWIVLKFICASTPSFLSSLYISSGKSATNARLLGGLAISSAIFISIITILFFSPQVLNTYENRTLSTALLSIFFVTFYGYIDDKFEVRVRFKLVLQLTSILYFSFFNAQALSPEHSTLAFLFLSILGLALVNGTNLLDGLDTLSVKLGITSSFAFLYLGILAQSTATILLSSVMISTLSVFYFFNREPAKVYMGEIGGSIIGLTYFVQATICLIQLKYHYKGPQNFSLVMIACLFPISELGLSFIRRIASKKSPFRGDRLHMHYIIKNKYKLTASQTSNRMGAGSAALLITGFLVSKSYGPIIALSFVSVCTLQIYLKICVQEWKANLKNKEAENLFKSFEGKTVNIIDSNQFNSLDISLREIHKDNEKKKTA